MQKIMFNDKLGLTKAVLEGKKTQTRRLALNSEDTQVFNLYPEDKSIQKYVIDRYSRYKVGETLAVAQSYEKIHTEMESRPVEDFSNPTIHVENIDGLIETEKSTKVKELLKLQDHSEIILDKGRKSQIVTIKEHQNLLLQEFKSNIIKTFIQAFGETPGWKSKMFVKAEFMPHQIRITNIRLERLQDISDEDCLKEGIQKCSEVHRIGYPIGVPFNYFICEDKRGNRYTTPREAYAALIDRISGKGTWDKNPWVFVYDFELVK